MSSMKDIATLAGVSRPTVSLILGGRGSRYSSETQRRVKEAADSLGYKPNILAKSFRENRSYLIGVLTSAVNAPIAGQFGRGVQSVVSDAGYAPVCFVHDSLGEELTCLDRCLDRQVDGLIVNVGIHRGGESVAHRYADLAKSKQLPVVEVFGDRVPGACNVGIDFYQLGKDSVEYLLAAGHRSILLFTHSKYLESEQHPGHFFNAYDRWRGYRDAMVGAGLEPVVVTRDLPEVVHDSEAAFATACRAASTVLRHASSPTAVVCNDTADALALKLTVSKSGWSHQHRLAVVTASGIEPEHSSVVEMIVPQVPVEKIGQKAASLLFDQIDDGEARSNQSALFPAAKFLTSSHHCIDGTPKAGP